MAESGSIAVVVPVYNRRLKLINTLATVVNQSKKPALLIVVDDGSSDGTGEFAESWLARNASFEWKVIRQANAGAAVARNAGFAAIGELPFVCFLDSDDLSKREICTTRDMTAQVCLVSRVEHHERQPDRCRRRACKLPFSKGQSPLWRVAG
jgi:Glycosyl transferase family 2